MDAVIICIGSASVTGDSLGPMVGDILRNDLSAGAFVYGGLRRPVNGVNYREYAEFVRKRHPCGLIIAVDACVGKAEDVGKIKLSLNGLAAGGALNRGFERIGDIGILGVVAPRGTDNLSALMLVPYSLVDEMSARIADKIKDILTILKYNLNITQRLRNPSDYDIITENYNRVISSRRGLNG